MTSASTMPGRLADGLWLVTLIDLSGLILACFTLILATSTHRPLRQPTPTQVSGPLPAMAGDAIAAGPITLATVVLQHALRARGLQDMAEVQSGPDGTVSLVLKAGPIAALPAILSDLPAAGALTIIQAASDPGRLDTDLERLMTLTGQLQTMLPFPVRSELSLQHGAPTELRLRLARD